MEFHKAKSKELRKTNFYIGKHYPEYKTAYGRAYDPPRALSAAVDGSFNSTATHFTLGNSKDILESEAKSRYRSSHIRSESSGEGINRLETSKHHFDLGTDSCKFNTTAKEYLKKYENFTPSDFHTYLDQNRKINFTFGSGNCNRVSITKTSFTSKNSSNIKSERDSIRDEQKKNHYYIGQRKPNYKTSHVDDFPNKFRSYKPRYYSPNKYTLSLGVHKPSFKSINNQLFTPKAMQDLTIQSKTIDDMLDCHFSLGEHNSGHQTINQDVYSSKTLKNASQIMPETKMTSVKLGTSKNAWETSNKKTGDSFYKVEKADYPYKGSFVIMGFDNRKPPTTTQENYKRYAGVNQNRLDDFTSEDIKKRHFSFGSTNVNYEPVNKGYGDSPGKGTKMDEKFLNELKTVHYTFGNDEANMTSTAKSEFTKKHSPVHVAKGGSGAHSIVLGTHTNNWMTMRNVDARRTIG